MGKGTTPLPTKRGEESSSKYSRTQAGMVRGYFSLPRAERLVTRRYQKSGNFGSKQVEHQFVKQTWTGLSQRRNGTVEQHEQDVEKGLSCVDAH